MSDNENVSTKKQDINDDNQQEKLVPELRFPRFNDYSNWYKKDLSRIGKIITGNTPSTKNKEYWGGNNQWITPTDINESRFVINSERKLSNKGFEKSRHVPKDSVLVTCIASIGKNCITNKTTSFNQQINGIIPNKDYSSRFIYYLMEYYSPKLSKFAGITATPILNKKDFSKMTFMFPSFNEQKRIGNFLSLIDEKIELLEKTLCLHQKFIEGLKESIFSNLNYPKFKLNNFMKISKIKCNDNINKRLTVKLNLKGIVPRETKTTEKEGVTTQYIRKKGQFIYGKQNLYKGAFGIIPKELDGYMSSSDIPSFDFINNKLNPYWFYYFISRKNYYSRLEKYSTGTGSKRISPEEFLNIKIPLPPIEKQNNQVKMFNKLIERQNILIKEKEYLYNFKKGLLQKMFV